MPRISIGDCHLYCERHGGGFPVVFASGLTGQAAFWREQIPTFSREFEAVVFDHRGVGQSDHSRISYTVERLAADVIALMDALGIEKAHLVGHSTGGAIAQILAIEHAKRLASVVISAMTPLRSGTGIRSSASSSTGGMPTGRLRRAARARSTRALHSPRHAFGVQRFRQCYSGLLL